MLQQSVVHGEKAVTVQCITNIMRKYSLGFMFSIQAGGHLSVSSPGVLSLQWRIRWRYLSGSSPLFSPELDLAGLSEGPAGLCFSVSDNLAPASCAVVLTDTDVCRWGSGLL